MRPPSIPEKTTDKMRIILTHEQLDHLQRLIDGEKLVIDTEAIESLGQLSEAVTRCIARNYAAVRRRNDSLNEKVERAKAKTEQKLLAGEFSDTGYDSAEVALALLYQLQQLRTYRLTGYKVNAILFEMYASWLHSKGQRLFLEHPVATAYGPRFWRAFKHIDTRVRVSYDDWKALAEKDPGVAQFCKNAAKKYYDVTERSLNEMFMKTDAYRKAMPEFNDGKWNKELDDADIYAWKKQQSEKA